MKSLDLLEQRINSLLNKVSSLSDENTKLKIENEQGLNSLAEENRILNEENSLLKEKLVQENQCKDTVSERIDLMIERLKAKLGDD